MKKIISLCIGLVLVSHLGFSQKSQVKIGNNPYTLNASAALEVESTSKGFLPPRMTLVQKDAIPVSTATKGLTVYCTDCTPAGLYSYDGSAWSANATTTTNIAAGALGAVPYQSAAGTTSFLAGNTSSTPKILTSTGSSTAAAAPTWTDVSSVAVPYTGATGAVDLGAYDLKVNGLTVGKGAGTGTTNDYNTAVGLNSLGSNESGQSNTAVGSGALTANTTGSWNNSQGSLSLSANTTGNANIAIGFKSLFNNLTGNGNVAFGHSSLVSNTLGDSNVGIGASSLAYNTSGKENVGIGRYSLHQSSGNDSNVSIGSYSLESFKDGNYNIGLGYKSGGGFETGNSNIFIGSNINNSGHLEGNYNTIIGSDITGLSNLFDNNIILADGQGNIRARYNNGWTFGNVTLPSTTVTLATVGPAVSVYCGVVKSLAGTGGNFKIDFDTEEFDTDNSYDLVTKKFTPLVAGYYYFDAQITCESSATTTNFYMYMYKKGVAFKKGTINDGTGKSIVNVISGLVYLNGIDDYLEPYVTMTGTSGTLKYSGGTSGQFKSATSFQAYYVRP